MVWSVYTSSPWPHCSLTTSCMSYFSYCCDKNSLQKQLKERKTFFWKTPPGDTVLHGMKGMVIASRGTWLHCLYNQEAENDECLCLTHFPLLKFSLLSVPFLFRTVLSTSVNSTQIIPYTYAQRFVSMLTQSPISFIIKNNNYKPTLSQLDTQTYYCSLLLSTPCPHRFMTIS